MIEFDNYNLIKDRDELILHLLGEDIKIPIKVFISSLIDTYLDVIVDAKTQTIYDFND